MKKIYKTLLLLTLIIVFVFSFAGCSEKPVTYTDISDEKTIEAVNKSINKLKEVVADESNFTISGSGKISAEGISGNISANATLFMEGKVPTYAFSYDMDLVEGASSTSQQLSVYFVKEEDKFVQYNGFSNSEKIGEDKPVVSENFTSSDVSQAEIDSIIAQFETMFDTSVGDLITPEIIAELNADEFYGKVGSDGSTVLTIKIKDETTNTVDGVQTVISTQNIEVNIRINSSAQITKITMDVESVEKDVTNSAKGDVSISYIKGKPSKIKLSANIVNDNKTASISGEVNIKYSSKKIVVPDKDKYTKA